MEVTDWTGSTAQRRGQRDDCRYPGAKPTPRHTVYFVPANTQALVKRAGDKQWRRHTTSQPLTFDSTYSTTDASLIFFRVGFLLCVKREQAQQQTNEGVSHDT